MIAHFDETRHVLVGQSPRTRQVLRLIDKLGKCRWPALLLGETGTGKEVVARAIHSLTAAKEPFVTIDCSSMVGPLMESELFGHVKGAFTGAAIAKIGLIEAANGGTGRKIRTIESVVHDLRSPSWAPGLSTRGFFLLQSAAAIA